MFCKGTLRCKIYFHKGETIQNTTGFSLKQEKSKKLLTRCLFFKKFTHVYLAIYFKAKCSFKCIDLYRL
jgi:hypothetical protein